MIVALAFLGGIFIAALGAACAWNAWALNAVHQRVLYLERVAGTSKGAEEPLPVEIPPGPAKPTAIDKARAESPFEVNLPRIRTRREAIHRYEVEQARAAREAQAERIRVQHERELEAERAKANS